jgi:DNA-binding NarL/FixJ family response regulator
MDNPRPLTLPPQQSRVAQLLLDGKNPQETATAMNVAIGTVKTHRSLLYRRLGVSSAKEAAERLGALGWTPTVTEPTS